MKEFRADLHIHTVLSPCGDLDMSPVNIVAEAARKGIDIIGITDHNTTRHCRLIKKVAADFGIFVLQGAEVTTKEEVHCLTFFEDKQTLSLFQKFLNHNLPSIMNDPVKFGYQIQVDENEMIVYEEKKLLINAINVSIDELENFVHGFGGIFIPAHVDRMKNSIFSQLGFFPPDLKVDALEVSKRSRPETFRSEHPELQGKKMISSSDAHYLEDIGSMTTIFSMEKASFQEVRMTLANINGRKLYWE
ncbi:MAG: PHP domain-containing protein [Bacteroidales bacterium]|nr:PHP domain-containing protein [Bacteroidales bacterium]